MARKCSRYKTCKNSGYYNGTWYCKIPSMYHRICNRHPNIHVKDYYKNKKVVTAYKNPTK